MHGNYAGGQGGNMGYKPRQQNNNNYQNRG